MPKSGVPEPSIGVNLPRGFGGSILGPVKRTSTRLIVLLSLTAVCRLSVATAEPPAGPVDILEAPKFLGLQVLDYRVGVNEHGQPISTTVVAGSYDSVFGRLKALGRVPIEFAKGWTIEGLGSTDSTGITSTTLDAPDGQRYVVRGKPIDNERYELVMRGKPNLRTPVRWAEPAPDREPREH